MSRCYNRQPTISIIVPVYNVEPYLRACLDSIKMQSFTDWEMLLIDDGSTDKGGIICDEYAAEDNRIRVFHQENQGLSAARNTGLDHTRGQYITMIDSDDVLLSDEYLSILYRTITEYSAQLSLVNFQPFSGDLPPHIQNPHPSLRCYNGLDAYAHHFGQSGFNYGHSGGKLFEKKLFDDIRYPVGKLSEDNAISHLLFSPCEKVVVINSRLYGYRVREGSIMTSSNRSLLIHDIVSAFHGRITYFNQLGRHDLSYLAEQELLKVLHIVRKIGVGK